MEAGTARRSDAVGYDGWWPGVRWRRQRAVQSFDDKTGKVLWEVNLGSQVSGFPVTYAVGGKQYVAVTTGASLVGNSALRMTPELKPGNAANVFVFSLP